MTYTQEQKDAIKRNPLNRANAAGIRAITTRYYREYKAAEVVAQSVTSPKALKEANERLQKAKGDYDEARVKFDLYKELFPDIVK